MIVYIYHDTELCLLFIHPPAHGSEVSPAARNPLDSAQIPRTSKLLICGLFQKGRVLAQDGDRLVFGSDAVRSLEKSAFVKTNEARAVVWECLRAVATELYELVMQDLSAQQIADEFRSRTPFDLTWTESKETKRDTRLVGLRKIIYEGQELDITPHVKWGNKAPRLLRVHFHVDRDRRRIIIGHCGDHLDTYGTRRRR